MKFKYMKDMWGTEPQITYYEIDEEGTTYRQILIENNKIIVSNRPFDTYHFYLAEKEVLFFPEKEIPKKEFESVWLRGIQPFLNNWIEVKKDYRIGQRVQGKIEVIYPQGIIINLGNNRFAVADYYECEKVSGSDKIFTQNAIKGVVSGFDDLNLWVKIAQPEIILES